MIKTPVFIVQSFNEGPVFGLMGCSIYGLLGAYTAPGAATLNFRASVRCYQHFNIDVEIGFAYTNVGQ